MHYKIFLNNKQFAKLIIHIEKIKPTIVSFIKINNCVKSH